MAGDVIKMVIQLDDKASPALKKVESSTEAAGKASVKSAKGFKMSGAQLAKMGAMALGAAAAFGKMVQALADSRNELIDTSTRTGLATSTIAGLRLAAEGSGMQFTSLAAGLQQLPKRMSDMANGTGEAKKAFEALGVSVLNSSGELRSADDVLKESLSKILALESPTQKAALATELFGRSGTGMLQALSGTELQDFVDQAERFGVSVGPDAAKAAGDFQRELATFNMITEKANETFLSAFGPGPGGASSMLKVFGATLIGVTTMFKSAMDIGRRSFGVITGAIADLLAAIMHLGDAMVQVFAGDFEAGGRSAKKSLAVIKAGIVTAAEETAGVFVDNISAKAVRDGIAAGMAAFDAPTAGTGGTAQRQAFRTPTGAEDGAGDSKAADKAAKDREKARNAAEAAAKKQAEAWAQMLIDLDELNAQMKALPCEIGGAVLEGMASPKTGILDAISAAGPTGSAIAGIMGTLSSMGEKGAKAIKAELKGFIRSMIVGLTEVLPELIGVLPVELIKAIPKLISGIVKAVPLIAKAMFIDLPKQLIQTFGRWLVKAIGGFFRFFIDDMPSAIWKGVKRWFKGAIKAFKDMISDLNPFKKKGGIFTPETKKGRRRLAVATLGISEVVRGAKGLVKGSKQTGGFTTGGTGLYMLHAGERVIPATGASTSAMEAAAGNIGSGQAITINTNVVDPNALESLGRLLDRQFGEKGR